MLTVLLALLVTPQRSAAETCTSVTSGDWSADATWDCGSAGSADTDGVPGAGDTAEIGHQVTLRTDVTVGTVNVATDGFILSPPASDNVNVTLTVESNMEILENPDDFVQFDAGKSSGPSSSTVGLDINGSLTNNGIIDFTNASTTTFEVFGSITNASSAKVTFGGVTCDVRGTVTNDGRLDMTSANSQLEIGGNFENDASTGDLDMNNPSKVVFTGDLVGGGITSQALLGDFSGDNAFQDLTVTADGFVNPSNSLGENGSGNAVQIDRILTINTGGQYGTGDPDEQTVSEEADLEYKGSQFIVNGDLFSNKVIFSASNISNGTTTTVEGAVFGEVRVRNATSVTVGQDNFAVVGLVAINSGSTLDVTDTTLRLLGDFQVNGDGTPDALVADGGTISFEGEGRETCCSGSNLSETKNNIQEVVGTAVIDFGSVEVQDRDGSTDTDPDTKVVFLTSDSAIKIAQSLTIDEAELRTARPIEALGNFTGVNSGSFRITDDVSFTFTGGSANQEFSFPETVYVPTFVVNKTGGTVDIATPVDVERVVMKDGDLAPSSSVNIGTSLKLEGGNLDLTTTGGSATLLSNDTTDAVVEYVGDGSGNVPGGVDGSLVVQRQLNDDQDFYSLTGPAGESTNPKYEDFLETATSSDANDLWIQGIPGGDAGGSRSSFANVLVYDEEVEGASKNVGFEPIAGMGTNMTPGQGFFLYAFSDDDFEDEQDEEFPKLIDTQVDPYDKTSFTFGGLTGTAGSSYGPEDGWNFLGNPYLAPVDWNEFCSRAPASNLELTVYVYDPQNQSYSTYTCDKNSENTGSGTGALGENGGVIAPLQGFFVRLGSAGTESFSISDVTAAQATGASDPFLKSQSQDSRLLALKMEADNVERDANIAFFSGGTLGHDRYDALQLEPPVDKKTDVSLYSVLDGTGFASQSLPADLGEEVTIPVEAKASGCVSGQPYSTSATITWPAFQNIPAGADLILTDTQTGEEIDLRTQDEYTFDLTADTDCSTQTNAKTQDSADREVPNLRNPSVVTHTQSKASGPSTRFTLTIKPNGTLPVEFTSFTGSVADNAAKLEWTTATEQNNAGFQVQQKVDGSFQNIDGAFVEGAGTSEEPQSYSYRVEDLDAGQHTFRLKQVDVDGGSSFSKETTVKVGLDSQYELKAYPNPISEQATIKFAVKESQDVTLELYNTLGQRVQVLHQGSVPSSQTRTVSLQASDLSSGLYIVRMRGESFSTTKSVTVVR
jgi:hypothetical protein